MTLKTMAKRLTGSGVEVPPPADETVDERAEAASRLKRLLDAAATESGQRVGNLHELQDVRHVLVSKRLKVRQARGVPAARALREVDAELDDQEDEAARLTVESRGFEQQQAAERARRQTQEFEHTATAMTELTREMLASPELAAVVAAFRPLHVRALKIRQALITTSDNIAARIPDSRPYLGLRTWSLPELVAKAVMHYEERHKGERA